MKKISVIITDIYIYIYIYIYILLLLFNPSEAMLYFFIFLFYNFSDNFDINKSDKNEITAMLFNNYNI